MITTTRKEKSTHSAILFIAFIAICIWGISFFLSLEYQGFWRVIGPLSGGIGFIIGGYDLVNNDKKMNTYIGWILLVSGILAIMNSIYLYSRFY